jgi:hypothetical protein
MDIKILHLPQTDLLTLKYIISWVLASFPLEYLCLLFLKYHPLFKFYTSVLQQIVVGQMDKENVTSISCYTCTKSSFEMD